MCSSAHLRICETVCVHARAARSGVNQTRAHTSTVLGGALGYSLMPVLNRYPRLVQKLKVRGGGPIERALIATSR